MNHKICGKCNAIMAAGHIACSACGADVTEAQIWLTARNFTSATSSKIAIVCPVCQAEITWGEWSRLPLCGDGTTDPEFEPGEEPETQHCRCGSTITVDLPTRHH